MRKLTDFEKSNGKESLYRRRSVGNRARNKTEASRTNEQTKKMKAEIHEDIKSIFGDKISE